jgi:hypothetical protein
MVASIQGAYLASLVGLGVSPSHALNIVALHVSIPNKEESKYLFHFEDLVGCPQIVRTRRKWFDNFRTDVVASIHPLLYPKSRKTMNLLMREIAERILNLRLSKVYSFLDIFWKMSSFQAFANPY